MTGNKVYNNPQSEETTLFTGIELYRLSHDEKGKDRSEPRLSRKLESIRHYENLHLCKGLRFTKQNGFPEINAFKGPVEFEFISFSDRLRHSGDNIAVHFFIDDYKFENLLNKKIDKVTMEISRLGAVFAPDFSLYADVPEIFIKYMIFKRQLYGAYWQQKCGFNVIPVAGLPRADALEYTFEGIPENSVIGYCGTGHDISKASRDLWLGGIYELEERKKPELLLIYGKRQPIPGLKTPVMFIPDHITKNIR